MGRPRDRLKATAVERVGLLIGGGALGAMFVGQVYFIAQLL
jgi:hypothetical protein